MTYAIIEASGKQFRVEAGRFYDLDRLPVEENETISIDKVLFVSHDGESMVGQPLVEGATVSGTVMRHLRGRKVIVYKMKPKKKTRKKRGHRQELTRLMIDAINLNGDVLSGETTDATAEISQPSTASATSSSSDEGTSAPEEAVTATTASSAESPLAETPTEEEAIVANLDEPVVVVDDSIPAVAEAVEVDASPAG